MKLIPGLLKPDIGYKRDNYGYKLISLLDFIEYMLVLIFELNHLQLNYYSLPMYYIQMPQPPCIFSIY